MSRYAEFEDYIPSHAAGTYGFPGPFPETSDYYPSAQVPIPVPGRGRQTSRPARRRTTLSPSPVPGHFCCDNLGCCNSRIPVSLENPTSRQFRNALKDDLLYTPNASPRSCSVFNSDPFDSSGRAWNVSRSLPLRFKQFRPSYGSLGDDPYSHLSNVHRRASEILTAGRLSQRPEILVGDGYGFCSNPYINPYSPYSVDSSRARDVYGDPWNSYLGGNQHHNYFHYKDDLYDEDKIYDETERSFPVGFSEYGFDDSF
jgi:hypothetical protein